MTRVAAVDLVNLEIPLTVPLEFATGVSRVHEMGVVRIIGDDGTEGLAEHVGALPPGADRLADMLVGLDTADAGVLAATLARLDHLAWAGRPMRSAASAALSDLAARGQARPLAASLGGERHASVSLNALVGRLPPDEAALTAVDLVARGYGCLKVKGGHEPPARLVGRVAAIRSAVGPDVALRLDLNGSLDPPSAESTLRRLGPFDLEYVEQPVAASEGVSALVRLRRGSGMRIAADESVADVPAARALLATHAVDALVVKPARVGGLAEARAIVVAAADAGVPVTLSTMLESGLGIAGALAVAVGAPGDQAHGLATAALLESDLLASPLAIEAGRMAAPTGPGLGVRLDGAALERFRVA